ncbi:MAG: inovirus Gp2 family protein [Cellvibrionaceae bacterium]
MYWNEPSSYPALKRNPNLNYTRKWRYRGLPVIHGRGPLITQYLDSIIDTLEKALSESPEIVVYRFDLRFPYWVGADDIGEMGQNLITKFWASVTSQLIACDKRLKGNVSFVSGSRRRNIWCKELPRIDGTPHYHAALILDSEFFEIIRDIYQSTSLEKIVKEAWARIIGVPLYESPNAVWIPENNIYYVSRDDPNSYAEAFERLSYLAKSSTKLYHDGSQWFRATSF